MTDTIISVLSVAVALASAIVSVIYANRSRRDTLLQHQMQIVSLTQQRTTLIQSWADRTIAELTQAIFLCDRNRSIHNVDTFREQCLLSKQQLSNLTEQGRLFLPNTDTETYGQYKLAAYQGFRPRALDCLVKAYRIVEQFDLSDPKHNSQQFKLLWDLRQNFVTEVQMIVDPKQQVQELEKLRKSV